MFTFCIRPTFPGRLKAAEELSWNIEEFLAAFSSRGWVERMTAASGLEAVFRQLVDSLKTPHNTQPADPSLVRQQPTLPPLSHLS